MRVIIAGTRTFNDYALLKKYCDHFLQNTNVTEIVSGCANGADTLGLKYARENGYPIKAMHADWKKYGKKAGPMRNEEMAKNADLLICFWDGESKGSISMIEIAERYKLPLCVVKYHDCLTTNKNI